MGFSRTELAMTHFKKGDSLRVINNLDEDGEVCEGGLAARAIVYDGVSKSLRTGVTY